MAKRKMIGTLFFALIAEMDLVIKNMINIFFVSHYLGAEGAAAYEVIMPCVMVPKENNLPCPCYNGPTFQREAASMTPNSTRAPRRSWWTRCWPSMEKSMHGGRRMKRKKRRQVITQGCIIPS